MRCKNASRQGLQPAAAAEMELLDVGELPEVFGKRHQPVAATAPVAKSELGELGEVTKAVRKRQQSRACGHVEHLKILQLTKSFAEE